MRKRALNLCIRQRVGKAPMPEASSPEGPETLVPQCLDLRTVGGPKVPL